MFRQHLQYFEIFLKCVKSAHFNESCLQYSHIAQNIAETCQKYFQSFIANEILSQYFCQILKDISSQLYNFNFLKYL